MAPELHPGVSSFSFIPGMKYAKGPVGGSTPVVFAGCLGPCDQASPPGVTEACAQGPVRWAWPAGTQAAQEGGRWEQAVRDPWSPLPPLLSQICVILLPGQSVPPTPCPLVLAHPGTCWLAWFVGGHGGWGDSGGAEGPGTRARPLHPSFLGCITFFFFFNSSPAPR